MATTTQNTGAAETAVKLVLGIVVAKVPVTVLGSMKDGKLDELSGLVKIDKSLNEYLNDLGPNFAGVSDVLKQLTGGPDVKLDSLAFGYWNRDPKFVQVTVTLTAGATRCRFVSLKSVGAASGGFVVGVELRLDSGLFKNNPLSGLTGEIALGDMGLYYSTAAFGNVEYSPGQNFPGPDDLLPEAQPSAGRRDFTQGVNWAAQIFMRGVNVLEGLSTIDKTKAALPQSAPAQQSGNASQAPQLKGPTTWINVNKSLGPLTVQRIGLRYEAPRVGIQFDVKLQLSVLTLSMLGMGISYPLDKFGDIKDPAKFFSNLNFLLDGATITFQQGPVLISGGLLIVTRSPLRLDGTLLVSIPAFSLAALGSYADLDGKPSIFAFAVLNRELGGPPYFFITGLAFGFGINRMLKLPSINEVQNFPLVRAAVDEKYLGADLDLRAVSQKLTEYLPPLAGNFWIAAGIKFTTFRQIDSFAMLSVSFGTHFQIALLGLSKIWVPKPPVPAIIYAELALKVVFDPQVGVFSAEARLTENSYILTRDFKIRGGFAFYLWFAGEHAGDFAISLGGYHPRFLPPAHYPKPDLVQFYCKMGDVTIQGSCYFAFCPSAIMAGGTLSLVFDSGGIKAWFIAYANFLVQWKPVHYDIEIGISVGVALNLNIGFIRVHISVELGASINLYGPPLGGVARISLYIITFTVSFGESKRVPPPLLWESNDPEKSFAKSFLTNPDVTSIILADGLLEEVKHGNDTTRFVNPHRLTINCRSQVPATNSLYNGNDAAGGRQPWWNQNIGVRPMGKKSCYSLFDVTFAPLVTAAPDQLKKMTDYMDQYVDISLVTGNAPQALWANNELDLKSPTSKQVVENVLLGVQIKTKAGPRPWETPVFDLKVLSYDRYTKNCAFAAVNARDALPDYKDKTITSTIADPGIAAKRKSIVEVLRRTGRRVMKPEEMQIQQLQQNARYIYQATPVMARAGQYPPRGYLET